MTTLPFKTYNEAKEFFGIGIPKKFYNNLIAIDTFSQTNGYDTLDTLFDIFGILRIEGKEARYQQTPIELFPFGSSGCDGTHYGFVIHTPDEEDNPSGEICPMDSDGVIMIGNTSHELFQNLLTGPIAIEKYSELLIKLQLEPVMSKNNRYDANGNGVRIKVNPKIGWRFIETTDGVGVFAEEKYFDTSHELFTNDINRTKMVEKFEKLAEEMRYKGLHASQLFYLKELYWNEWTNYELAKKYLEQMLLPYKELGRQHLYNTVKETLDTFDNRFPAWT